MIKVELTNEEISALVEAVTSIRSDLLVHKYDLAYKTVLRLDRLNTDAMWNRYGESLLNED
jgi:hypothetical protein